MPGVVDRASRAARMEGPLPLLQLLDECADDVPEMRRAVLNTPASHGENYSSCERSARGVDRLRQAQGRPDVAADQVCRGRDRFWSAQMIAKHDFPRVTLVGVISADIGLSSPTFAPRATFQLLTQVAGRAGRRAHGEAIIQTPTPSTTASRWPAVRIIRRSSSGSWRIAAACALSADGRVDQQGGPREDV